MKTILTIGFSAPQSQNPKKGLAKTIRGYQPRFLVDFKSKHISKGASAKEVTAINKQNRENRQKAMDKVMKDMAFKLSDAVVTEYPNGNYTQYKTEVLLEAKTEDAKLAARIGGDIKLRIGAQINGTFGLHYDDRMTATNEKDETKVSEKFEELLKVANAKDGDSVYVLSTSQSEKEEEEVKQETESNKAPAGEETQPPVSETQPASEPAKVTVLAEQTITPGTDNKGEEAKVEEAKVEGSETPETKEDSEEAKEAEVEADNKDGE